MKVVIPTIKHSGSHLCLNAFLGNGFEQVPLKNYKGGPNTVCMDHILYTKQRKLLEIAKTADLVVVPLRSPNLIALSWGNLGEELDPDFFQMLKDIKPFLELDNAVVLPLGGPEQVVQDAVDAILGQANVHIDVAHPVNSKGDTYGLPNDTKKVYEVCRRQDIERMKEMDLSHIWDYFAEPAVESKEEQEESSSTKAAGEKKPTAAAEKAVAGKSGTNSKDVD